MAARVYGSEMRAIWLGDRTIQYELTRKSVKNVNLRIDAAGNVKVSASRRVPLDFIEGFLRQKQELIVSAVGRAEENRRRQHGTGSSGQKGVHRAGGGCHLLSCEGSAECTP